jgi:hypothetical protein
VTQLAFRRLCASFIASWKPATIAGSAPGWWRATQQASLAGTYSVHGIGPDRFSHSTGTAQPRGDISSLTGTAWLNVASHLVARAPVDFRRLDEARQSRPVTVLDDTKGWAAARISKLLRHDRAPRSGGARQGRQSRGAVIDFSLIRQFCINPD